MKSTSWPTSHNFLDRSFTWQTLEGMSTNNLELGNSRNFPRDFSFGKQYALAEKEVISFSAKALLTRKFIEEYLQKRLSPFLRDHDVSTLFWPDLASCHYSKATVEWYKTNGMIFVPKEANSPNCPAQAN